MGDEQLGAATGHGRDLAEIGRRLGAWLRAVHGEPAEVTSVDRCSSGYSNETLDVRVAWPRGGPPGRGRLVLRLPPAGLGLFPSYDLAMQLRVQDLAATHDVPVPPSLAFEPDDRWLGAPFLVMGHVDGHIPGEVPAADRWITSAPTEAQRELYDRFLAVLAAIHRIAGTEASLAVGAPERRQRLDGELASWRAYVQWACGGRSLPALERALRWCEDHRPRSEPAPSLLWGDVRLGNVVFGDDRRVEAVLDWEMASVGPAEMDLGWFLALEGVQRELLGSTVPGFPARDEAVAAYEARLGRRVTDLDWHEVFALVRSTAVMARQSDVASRSGVAPPWSPERNPVLGVLVRRVEQADASGAREAR